MSFIAPNCLLPEIAAGSMVFQTLRLCHGLAVHRHARFGTDWLFDGLPVDFAAAVVLIFLLTWAAQPTSFCQDWFRRFMQIHLPGLKVDLTNGSDWEYPRAIEIAKVRAPNKSGRPRN
jgi:hypothetical protein